MKPLNSAYVASLTFADREVEYSKRDSILYSLGIGLGMDPSDPYQLRYVYEEGLLAFPTMITVLGYPGHWYKDPETGIDPSHIVHGEEFVQLYAPLPPAGRITAENRILNIVDKGSGRGALITVEKQVRAVESGVHIGSVYTTVFCRGQGGFGGNRVTLQIPDSSHIPRREPDFTAVSPTSPQAALIYRLSGDDNPLHVDPTFARRAGFDRPILHGLSTFGVVAHALFKRITSDTVTPRSIRCRFASPVMPGETLHTSFWLVHDETYVFRSIVLERDKVVLEGGEAVVGVAGSVAVGSS